MKGIGCCEDMKTTTLSLFDPLERGWRWVVRFGRVSATSIRDSNS